MEDSMYIQIEAARNGDIKAFEALVKKYMKKAYNIALGMTGSHDDAMDISQNAFVKAHKGIRKLKSSESFESWLYTITRRETLSFFRSKKNKCTVSIDSNPLILNIPDSVAAECNNKEELAKAVWEALCSLEIEQREILIMQHFQKMNYKEISGALNIPFGTVASRLYVARTALRQKLDKFLL